MRGARERVMKLCRVRKTALDVVGSGSPEERCIPLPSLWQAFPTRVGSTSGPMCRASTARARTPTLRLLPLGHLPDIGGGVEGLRRDISAIRPADGRAGHKEFTKASRLLERLKDGPLKPGLKVHCLRAPVVER